MYLINVSDLQNLRMEIFGLSAIKNMNTNIVVPNEFRKISQDFNEFLQFFCILSKMHTFVDHLLVNLHFQVHCTFSTNTLNMNENVLKILVKYMLAQTYSVLFD